MLLPYVKNISDKSAKILLKGRTSAQVFKLKLFTRCLYIARNIHMINQAFDEHIV